MKLTDGKKTVKITMHVWNEPNMSPDFSNDFFEAGGLDRGEEAGAYIVPDTDYCIEQAENWRDQIGDFCGDNSGEERYVFTEIEEKKAK